MNYESIEAMLEDGVRVAVLANLSGNPALSGVQVNGFFLPATSAEGDTPNKRRDTYTGPRINLTAAPNIPTGYQSVSRSIDFTVECLTQPDGDPDRAICRAMYYAARKVFEKREFRMPDEAIAEIRGYLITGSSAGVTEQGGWTVQFTVTVKVFVKAAA